MERIKKDRMKLVPISHRARRSTEAAAAALRKQRAGGSDDDDVKCNHSGSRTIHLNDTKVFVRHSPIENDFFNVYVYVKRTESHLEVKSWGS